MKVKHYVKDVMRIEVLASVLHDDYLVEHDNLLLLNSFIAFKESVTEEAYSEICNSAGAKGYGFLVPDSMYGLNMTIVFDHHDFCYDKFSGERGKELSDLLMKVNMLLYIDENTTNVWGIGSTLRFLRKRRALKYYYAVHLAGKWFYN